MASLDCKGDYFLNVAVYSKLGKALADGAIPSKYIPDRIWRKLWSKYQPR